MLEYNNPAIDVDDLMSRIQQEVSKRGVGYEPLVLDGDGSQAHPLASIEALLNTAQAKAEVRTKWSGQLNVFPFNRSVRLQQIVLRILAYVFKDQRHVNLSLTQAQRESLVAIRGLLQRVALLEAEVKRLRAGDYEPELEP